MIEGGEVTGFLIIHMRHQGTQMRMCICDWRGLRGVDQGCCELAGLVDAQGAGEEIFLGLGQGLA